MTRIRLRPDSTDKDLSNKDSTNKDLASKDLTNEKLASKTLARTEPARNRRREGRRAGP
jgi:hypothetical protein